MLNFHRVYRKPNSTSIASKAIARVTDSYASIPLSISGKRSKGMEAFYPSANREKESDSSVSQNIPKSFRGSLLLQDFPALISSSRTSHQHTTLTAVNRQYMIIPFRTQTDPN